MGPTRRTRRTVQSVERIERVECVNPVGRVQRGQWVSRVERGHRVGRAQRVLRLRRRYAVAEATIVDYERAWMRGAQAPLEAAAATFARKASANRRVTGPGRPSPMR